jgi:tetratricopeptide (TPR) repeat protein
MLDEKQLDLLVGMAPSAFGGDRATWGLCLAQGWALRGDAAKTRSHAAEAKKEIEEQLKSAPEDAQRRVGLGLALAYMGDTAGGVREAQRGVAMLPIAKDGFTGPFLQHQLARIYVLAGEPEKALDQLEPLLKIPYILSPGWLRIDPNFAPLRETPRFQKLVSES